MTHKQKYTQSEIKDLTIQLKHIHLLHITCGNFTYDQSVNFFNSLDKKIKKESYNKTIRLIKVVNDLNSIVKMEYNEIKNLIGLRFNSLPESWKIKSYEDAKKIQSIITKFLEGKVS